VSRYGKQDEAVRISDLESSGSDADYDEAGTPLSSQRGGRRKKRGGRHGRDFDDSSGMILSNAGAGGHGEGYSRSDCFNVEKMLLIFGSAFSYVYYSKRNKTVLNIDCNIFFINSNYYLSATEKIDM